MTREETPADAGGNPAAEEAGVSSPHDSPEHLAVIMDGNARSANRQNRLRAEGHARGAEVLRDMTRWVRERGISQMTCYALSTENYLERPREEVDFLLDLLARYLRSEREELDRLGICFRVIGRTAELPDETGQLLEETVALTKQNRDLVLRLAINYGGRAELNDAVSRLQNSAAGTQLKDCLYEPEMPDVDLLIRSGGEIRLSNFLPWQTSYAELHFSPVLWPDFTEADLDQALDQYSRRTRRFGRLPAWDSEAQ